jgi:hypothetical protein
VVGVAGVSCDAGGGALSRRVVGLLVRVADCVVPGAPPVWPLRNRAWVQ